MCNNNNEDCKCIAGILKVILAIQKGSKHEACDFETCDRAKLGDNKVISSLNTRPLHLFLCCNNGDNPLEMPVDNEPIRPSTKFSNIFRVEKLDECCATFRVLEEKKGSSQTLENNTKVELVATDSFFTLDLKCVCVIKCLEDAFVEGL